MESKPNFSELAQKVISNYYQGFVGSLQNNSHSKALLYSQKIEKLRTNFLNYLGLEDFLVSLQPNKHYLEKVIFNFLNLEASGWDVFTDSEELEIKGSGFYSLKDFLELQELKIPTFVLVEKRDTNLALISEKISCLKSKACGFPIYSYLASKSLAQLKNNSLNDFSFVSYDSSEELSEFGTVFFGFQKDLKLKPVFLGSGGAKFDHNSKRIKLRELPYLLEIGTQNLVSWLVLAEYFEAFALDSIKDVS